MGDSKILGVFFKGPHKKHHRGNNKVIEGYNKVIYELQSKLLIYPLITLLPLYMTPPL